MWAPAPSALHSPFTCLPAPTPASAHTSHTSPRPPLLPHCSATFDPDTIRSRLRELAFLNSRATIYFRAVEPAKGSASKRASSSSSSSEAAAANGNGAAAAAAAEGNGSSNGAAAAEAEPDWEVFHYSGGLAEYVRFLNRDKVPIHEPLCFSKQASGLRRGCQCPSQGLFGRRPAFLSHQIAELCGWGWLQVDGYTVEIAMQWCSDAFRCCRRQPARLPSPPLASPCPPHLTPLAC